MAPGKKRGKGSSIAVAAAAEWNIGDLVLAKVKGFPAWPAQISAFTPEARANLIAKSKSKCTPADLRLAVKEICDVADKKNGNGNGNGGGLARVDELNEVLYNDEDLAEDDFEGVAQVTGDGHRIGFEDESDEGACSNLTMGTDGKAGRIDGDWDSADANACSSSLEGESLDEPEVSKGIMMLEKVPTNFASHEELDTFSFDSHDFFEETAIDGVTSSRVEEPRCTKDSESSGTVATTSKRSVPVSAKPKESSFALPKTICRRKRKQNTAKGRPSKEAIMKLESSIPPVPEIVAEKLNGMEHLTERELPVFSSSSKRNKWERAVSEKNEHKRSRSRDFQLEKSDPPKIMSDPDEHLPIVKRARARAATDEDSCEPSYKQAEVERNSESWPKPVAVQKANIESVKNVGDEMKEERSLPPKADKHRIRSSLLDGEAALPPSKRRQRALEAMTACVAEAMASSAEAQCAKKFELLEEAAAYVSQHPVEMSQKRISPEGANLNDHTDADSGNPDSMANGRHFVDKEVDPVSVGQSIQERIAAVPKTPDKIQIQQPLEFAQYGSSAVKSLIDRPEASGNAPPDKYEASVVKVEAEAIKVHPEKLQFEKVQNENDRVQSEKLQPDRLQSDTVKSERVQSEKVQSEKVQLERVERVQFQSEKVQVQLESERVQSERIETVQSERVQSERVQREKVQTERVQSEKVQSERERVQSERVERVQSEKLQSEKVQPERVQTERVHSEKAESSRLQSEIFEGSRIQTVKTVQPEKAETKPKLVRSRRSPHYSKQASTSFDKPHTEFHSGDYLTANEFEHTFVKTKSESSSLVRPKFTHVDVGKVNGTVNVKVDSFDVSLVANNSRFQAEGEVNEVRKAYEAAKQKLASKDGDVAIPSTSMKYLSHSKQVYFPDSVTARMSPSKVTISPTSGAADLSRTFVPEHISTYPDFDKGQETSAEAMTTFDALLDVLSRAKDSILRATRQALDCARLGLCPQVIDLIAKRLETEQSFHRRIDLFFLIDSIIQSSYNLRGTAAGTYRTVVQNSLPRLLTAAAPPGGFARENRRQCLKVLKLWLERSFLPPNVVQHFMHEIELHNIDKMVMMTSRRPSRTERPVDDPIREMEGMHVDEYGSNASFSLPGLQIPRLFEDEEEAEESHEAGSDGSGGDNGGGGGGGCGGGESIAASHERLGRHALVLEEVDGELEMEDVSPVSEWSNQQYDSRIPAAASPASTLCGPPLPADPPPSLPPLPSSPPPFTPPPPSSTYIPQHTCDYEQQLLQQQQQQQLYNTGVYEPSQCCDDNQMDASAAYGYPYAPSSADQSFTDVPASPYHQYQSHQYGYPLPNANDSYSYQPYAAPPPPPPPPQHQQQHQWSDSSPNKFPHSEHYYGSAEVYRNEGSGGFVHPHQSQLHTTGASSSTWYHQQSW